MLTDALVSAGVVISGVIITLFDIYWLDPVVSLIIVAVIFTMTWKLLKETIRLSIDAVPENINISEVYDYFKSVEGIKDIHDLHIWSLSTSQIALTAHLVLKNNFIFTNEMLQSINQELHNKFEINHSTIQTEHDSNDKFCSNC